MTAAGGVALLLSAFLMWRLAGGDRRLMLFYFALMAAHIAASAAFWVIAQSGPADAVAYYRRALVSDDFGISTQFILFLTHLLRVWLGAGFFDAFLFFQLPGLVGIVLLHKAAARLVEDEIGTRLVLLALLMFLPGLQFWTAAIGKDALAVLAYGLIALGLARRNIGWESVGAGLLLYFLVRPHVGFIACLAMMLAFLPLFGQSRPAARIAGLGAGVVVVALLPFVVSFVGLETAGIGEVGSYISERQSVNQGGSTSFDLASQSPPMRVVTFLYRPLFFDAPGALGLVVSVENLVLLSLSLYLLWHAGALLRLLRLSEVLRFHALFALILTLALSQTIANTGLAVRQKMMVVPALLLLFAAVAAIGKRREEDRLRALLAETERTSERSCGGGSCGGGSCGPGLVQDRLRRTQSYQQSMVVGVRSRWIAETPGSGPDFLFNLGKAEPILD